jgi:hypothetical protein
LHLDAVYRFVSGPSRANLTSLNFFVIDGVTEARTRSALVDGVGELLSA